MQKTVLTLVVVAVALGAVYYLFLGQQPAAPAGAEIRATFACAEGKSMGAVFYPGNDTHVDLVLSDGRQMSLPRAISASGARYADADESIVFWNRGNTAFMTEDGVTTYEGCVEQGSEAPPSLPPPAAPLPPSMPGIPGGGEPVACTMDAMQCPDGTWVGRTGPNCEFVCP